LFFVCLKKLGNYPIKKVGQLMGACLAIVGGISSVLAGLRSTSILNGWKGKLRESIEANSKNVKTTKSLHTGENVGAYDQMGWHSTSEQKIMEDGIKSSSELSNRAIVAGICDFACGIGLLFLAGNSLHVFEGNVKPVIDALIVMEIALVYFLYLMIDKVMSKRRFVQGMVSLLQRKEDFNANPAQMMDVFELNGFYHKVLGLSTPAWDQCKPATTYSVEQVVISSVLKGSSKLNHVSSESMYGEIVKSRAEYSWEIMLFLLNFIAGYGYLLGAYVV
jgi:hypothetical protein